MNADHSARALHHLTLALAGVTLTLAELPFLPWLPLGLILYLVLILTAHSLRGAYIMPAWAANVIALMAAAGTGVYAFVRVGRDDWAGDVPLPAALVPYLGPVLMALLCVRLFRPRSRDDFWLLQGLGLLQVGLGCVLASGTLFALALLAYLATAAAALEAAERQRRGRRSAWVSGPSGRAGGWMPFGLRWGVGVGLLTVPLFLLTPRTDQPDWDPLARFGLRATRGATARTGFGEEIDLSRTGRLVPDDAPAFWVEVRDRGGVRLDTLTPTTRFRGAVLDRYEMGVWRSEATWPGGVPLGRARPAFLDLGDRALALHFRVPRRAGGLFLLDPIPPSPEVNKIPVRGIGRSADARPLFFDLGGTPTPLSYLVQTEYRYEQLALPPLERERVRAVTFRDSYLLRLLRGGVPGLETWARDLIVRVAKDDRLRRALASTRGDMPPVWWEPMARALTEHLHAGGEYGYSLENQRSDPALDPTIDFLWHVKQGTCERYASALALMLRSQGIPARVVKGYRGAERQSPGVFVVRQSAAHAWVEALVPSAAGDGFDWLTLDPTPDTETTISSLAKWWDEQQRGGQEFWRELVVNYNRDQRTRLLERLWSLEALLEAVPWVIGVALALVAMWLVRRILKPRRGPAVLGATSLLDRVRRRLTAAGLVLPDNATAAEQADAARGWLAARGLADVAAVPGEVAELYYRVRYGGEAADEGELRRAAGRVEELARAVRGGR